MDFHYRYQLLAETLCSKSPVKCTVHDKLHSFARVMHSELSSWAGPFNRIVQAHYWNHIAPVEIHICRRDDVGLCALSDTDLYPF